MAVKVITYDVGTTGMKACLFDISAEESVINTYKVYSRQSQTSITESGETGGAEEDEADGTEVVDGAVTSDGAVTNR